jgi:hypothetical protein
MSSAQPLEWVPVPGLDLGVPEEVREAVEQLHFEVVEVQPTGEWEGWGFWGGC